MRNGDGDKKIPAQQRAEVRGLVSLRGSASASDTSGTLGVSPLDGSPRPRGAREVGFLGRGCGGAMSVESATSELRLKERRRHNRWERVRIGEHAVSFLEAGQSFVFDSCSTALDALDASGRMRVHVV